MSVSSISCFGGNSFRSKVSIDWRVYTSDVADVLTGPGVDGSPIIADLCHF